MITLKEVKSLVRYKENDYNALTFSDYDIKNALNEVLRYISLSQAATNSDFTNKGYTYDCHTMHCDFRMCGVPLPEDYVSLIGVRDLHGRLLNPCDTSAFPNRHEYKVSGNRLYCGAGAFHLMYKAELGEVDDDDDEIALPNQFKDLLVKLTRMALKQADEDVLQIAVEDAVEKVIPKRRYRNVKIKMPFRIGG